MDQTRHVLGLCEVRDECVVLCGPVWLLLAACNPKYGEGSRQWQMTPRLKIHQEIRARSVDLDFVSKLGGFL